MPAAARLTPRAPRRPLPAAAPFTVLDFARPVGPPSVDLVAAILRYADVEEDAGAGRVRRRISERRIAELAADGLLGAEAVRAADVAVLWDEAQGEILRVLDDAPARARSDRAWWEAYFEEPAAPRTRLAVARSHPAPNRGVR